MAKKCDLCRRSATKGASRSHSNIKTLKRQHINLQSKTIDGLKLKVCTSCLRTMNKPKRVKAKRLPGAGSAALVAAKKTAKKVAKSANRKKTK